MLLVLCIIFRDVVKLDDECEFVLSLAFTPS